MNCWPDSAMNRWVLLPRKRRWRLSKRIPPRFDAVLTDEILPGLRGSEPTRRLIGLRPGLPILLMSGNLCESVEDAARGLGVRAALHKPLALRELADGVAGLSSD